MTPSKDERLGHPDWVDAALRALTVGWLGSLSVERLATELGATKGSFYWHFKNRSALVDAALAEWERRDTEPAHLEGLGDRRPLESACHGCSASS